MVFKLKLTNPHNAENGKKATKFTVGVVLSAGSACRTFKTIQSIEISNLIISVLKSF